MVYLHKYAAATLFGARQRNGSNSIDNNENKGNGLTNHMLKKVESQNGIMH